MKIIQYTQTSRMNEKQVNGARQRMGSNLTEFGYPCKTFNLSETAHATTLPFGPKESQGIADLRILLAKTAT